MAETNPQVGQAADRLDRAITALEGRLRTLKSKASEPAGDLFASPAQAELDAYGKALETAGREASAALGRAARELRALLNGDL